MSPQTEHRTKSPRSTARALVLSILVLSAAAVQATAEPHQRRGPAPKVIRPTLVAFPDHPRFAIPGPLGVSAIAAQAWAGPPPALGYAPPPQEASWWSPQPSERWIRLRDLQESDFEAARQNLRVSP